MVFLLTLLTATYFGFVVWVWRAKRRSAQAPAPAAVALLSEDDLPPAGAVGWPPGGDNFTAYVDDGFAALDAYLSEGSSN